MIDLSKVRNYYIACGYTDLRLGIDGLAAVVTQQYARLQLRPGMDRSTVSRIQTAYDMQYNPFTMAEARQYVSEMLGEYEESRSVLARIRNRQQEQTVHRKAEKDRDR